MRNGYFTCLILLLSSGARADDVPPALQGVKMEMRLGQQVPLDLEFRDESDAPVRLRDLLRPDRPAVLVLAYYRCPMLCNLVLNGLSESLRKVAQTRGLIVGTDLDVIAVSFDPRDTPDIARAKRAAQAAHYGVPGAGERGWHFLCGREEEIRRLTETVGFRFRYDIATGQYAHASGVYLLTPAGRVARILPGIDYARDDLYYGLVEASAYRVGSPLRDRAALLFCYSYDPERGSYQLRVINLVRLSGVATVLGLGLLVWRLRRVEPAAEGGEACSPRSS